MNEKVLRFSKNWGGKLDKSFFTTVRQNKGYWQTLQGQRLDIELNKKHYCFGILKFVVPLSIYNVSEQLAQFDAGLSKEEFVELMRKMYGTNLNLQLLGIEKVPVRLASESVDLKKLKEKIKKEWKEHKENWSKDGEWFECNNVETDAYNNYSVGASITTTYADGREKTIILKTKKEADAYSEKQKKKFGGCSVCDRFESLLCCAEKEAKKNE